MFLIDVYVDGDDVVLLFEEDVIVLSTEEAKKLKDHLKEIL